jgi:hypothetical protein
MAEEKYKSVSVFALPDAYQQQAAEARRRRRMAEMLAQQAYQPGDIQNAPIPAAAPLVQGLQAYLAARAGRKADEAEESAMKAQTREARDFLRALTEPEKKIDVGQVALQDIAQMGTPELVDGRLEYRKTAMPAPTPEMIPQAGPQVRLGRRPEDDQIYMPTATGRETDPQRMAAMLANPQFKSGFTDEQRRSLALEGMLASENPMVQRVAGAIYPTLQPEKSKLQIGNIDPAKFTPASIAKALQTGNVSDLQAISTPSASKIGRPSFEDFTVASLAKFEETGDYNDLVEKPKPVGAAKVDKGPSESTLWRAEDKLRGDFEQITAPFRTQLAETQKITDIFQSYGNNPKAIAAIPQQSLVILLNKFLDPTSVVREGEFNRVVEAQGLEARAQNYLSRVMEGKPLDVSAINQIADLAKLYERAADAKIRQYANEYSAIAETRGLDIGSVISNPSYRPRTKIADEDVEVQ